MNERVCKTLEYDKIIDRLAEHATCDPGRRMCLSLKPLDDVSDMRRAASETADAAARIGQKGRLSFGALQSFDAELRALAVGGTLDMKALLAMAAMLENAGRAASYGKTESGVRDTLSDFFSALSPLEDLSAEIRRIVVSEEEIASDASPRLKQLRRETSLTTAKIRDVLNRMVNGTARQYLQDAVITMRGDRYCLPVRSEHKGQVAGIVHDRSSSGSTLFIEPQAVVDLNNKLREYALEEEKEIARILALLSAELSARLTDIGDNITYMTLLDFVFAKAAYGLEIEGAQPLFSEDTSFFLKSARHPLIDRDKVVATDIRLGGAGEGDARMLVITGPNTGGKTVTLKTSGLLTLMGMSGLMIPAAHDSRIAVFEEIYADIGDEQSIEQSLSTFSSHMSHIVRILEEADERSLCLIDELGAGTDPTEGAALAISILNHLLEKRVSVLATTHYAELKVFAMTTKGVLNASCEFDVGTLQPTYRLLIGTPGASNAFAVSKRLGLSEEIINGAKEQIDADKVRMETLFRDLEESRRVAEEERIEIARYREEQEALQARLREQEETLDTLGEDLLKEAHGEAERILKEAKLFADETIRLMRKSGADDALIADLERKRTALNLKIADTSKKKRGHEEREKKEKGRGLEAKDLVIGDRVKILSAGLSGTVSKLPDKEGRLTVTCGVMQVETKLSDLAPDEEHAENGKQIEKRYRMKGVSYVPAELNLIGKNTDDAISALDKYLDEAYMSHLPGVRIVHGKGTGTLRNAVQRHLKGVRYVKSFQDGAYGEGDTGVTVVKFKG
ncbi:MAG: endonuclease MutS2 [Lachnospiraceae bacterium]|nr:endonuclease MutS2 [Lachnospiraceae bacterium]